MTLHSTEDGTGRSLQGEDVGVVAACLTLHTGSCMAATSRTMLGSCLGIDGDRTLAVHQDLQRGCGILWSDHTSTIDIVAC